MIYVIAKAWQGGKIQTIVAYKTEAAAREEASQLIPINGETFNIIIFSVQLMDH